MSEGSDTGFPIRVVRMMIQERREWIKGRVDLIQAAGELKEPGGEIAFEALFSEMEFLYGLYMRIHEIEELLEMKRRWNL